MHRSLFSRMIFFICLGFFVSFCGPSPLTHHIRESETQTKMPQEKVSNKICTFSVSTSECFTIKWIKGPKIKVESQFLVELIDPQTAKALQATEVPEFDLWMPSMDHGSAPVTIERASDSEFIVSRVYFIMRGDWVVRLKKGNQVISQLNLELP
jgi:hypothetical protein